MSTHELITPGANWTSYKSALSSDGRFVVFASRASNLVAGDTNAWTDVFLRDRQTGTTERVSLTEAGAQMSSGALNGIPALGISGDGNLVLFVVDAPNLVSNDLNGRDDVFIRNRSAGTTICASVALEDGGTGNFGGGYASISANGRYVAFYSSSTDLSEDVSAGVFVRDLQEGTTRFLSTGGPPHMSRGGRYVSFVQFDGGVGIGRIRRYDLRNGANDLVSIGHDGSPANNHSFSSAISHDGRYVVFDSLATNLVPGDIVDSAWGVYLRDVQTNATSLIAQLGSDPRLSPNGRCIAYASPTGVKVYDRQTSTTHHIADSGQAGGFSADGTALSFMTEQAIDPDDTNDTYDVYVWTM